MEQPVVTVLGRHRHRPRVLLIAIAPLLLALFAVTFSISPLNGEDYGLSRLDLGQPLLDRLSWITQKSAYQWLHWNARLGEQLSIFWLTMPKSAFDAANSFVLATFFWLIATLARGVARIDYKSITLWSITAIVCTLLWPSLDYFFWRTIASGYLQTMAITVFVVCIVGIEELNQRFYSSRYLGPLAVLLAFLAGMSFENLPPVLVAYVAIWHYFGVPEVNRRCRFASDAGVCAALLTGWIVLLAAPSTWQRRAYYYEAFHVQPGLNNDLQRIADVIQKFFGSSWMLFLVSLVSLAILIKTQGCRRNRDMLCLSAAAILCVGSVVPAPYTEARAFGFAWIVMIIPCVRVLARYGNRLLYGAAAIAAVSALAYTLHAYLDFHMRVAERDSYIRANLGKPACAEGLPITLIPSHVSQGILNNREEWVSSSLVQVSIFYGCKLVLAQRGE